MATKALTIRIDSEQARRAEIVARTDGVSLNEVFKQALQHYFECKRADADFVARAQAMVARDVEIVGRLG